MIERTVIQAHEGELATVTRLDLPDLPEDHEPIAWKLLDRQLLEDLGHVDQARVRLTCEVDQLFRETPTSPRKLLEGPELSEISLLDGPLAGQTVPITATSGRDLILINQGNTEHYEVRWHYLGVAHFGLYVAASPPGVYRI